MSRFLITKRLKIFQLEKIGSNTGTAGTKRTKVTADEVPYYTVRKKAARKTQSMPKI
jgi:hypothetical protein